MKSRVSRVLKFCVKVAATAVAAVTLATVALAASQRPLTDETVESQLEWAESAGQALEAMNLDFYGRPTVFYESGRKFDVTYEGSRIIAVSTDGHRHHITTEYDVRSGEFTRVVATTEAGELAFDWWVRDDEFAQLVWKSAAILQAVELLQEASAAASRVTPPSIPAIAAVAPEVGVSRFRPDGLKASPTCSVAGVKACGVTYVTEAGNCGATRKAEWKDCEQDLAIAKLACELKYEQNKAACIATRDALLAELDMAINNVGQLGAAGVCIAITRLAPAAAAKIYGFPGCYAIAGQTMLKLLYTAAKGIANLSMLSCTTDSLIELNTCRWDAVDRADKCRLQADAKEDRCRCGVTNRWIACTNKACPAYPRDSKVCPAS